MTASEGGRVGLPEGHERFPCPCCSYLVFDGTPGSFDVCPICNWEDDLVQVRFPSSSGGANSVSVLEGQHNYRLFGACEARFRTHVRLSTDEDQRDPDWRPIELSQTSPGTT